MKNAVVLLAMLAVFCLAGTALAQDEFIAYKLDGKEIRLTGAKLLWHPENYLDFEGVFIEKVDYGENSFPRYREAELSVTFQIAPEGDKFVATHKAGSSDMIPVYFTWYEIIKKDEGLEIVSHQADLDSSMAGQFFSVTIDNFGPEGTLITGSFSGKLKGEDEKLHSIDEGKFSIRRKNAAD